MKLLDEVNGLLPSDIVRMVVQCIEEENISTVTLLDLSLIHI
jgi:hypothetical protein